MRALLWSCVSALTYSELPASLELPEEYPDRPPLFSAQDRSVCPEEARIVAASRARRGISVLRAARCVASS